MNGYISQTLSANTLFHFTNKIDDILNILHVDFYPHYCLENYYFYHSRRLLEWALPMVSFCDIPLSQIKNHIQYYGRYGIGLNKQWGITQGIGPVLYAHKNSLTVKYIDDIYDTVVRGGFYKMTKVETDVFQSYYHLLCYIKPYEGKLWRRGRYLDRPVRFYDEREWRYVPPINLKVGSADKDILPSLIKSHFLDDVRREAANNKMKRYRLAFEPKDIKYLIVVKEKEILPFKHQVEEIKRVFSDDDKEILVTRIISMEQILHDF